MPHPPKPT